MKPRELEAAIGFFLVCAILTGTATQEIPVDFFINQETGEPNVLIVVGTTAAAEDVISATKLAAVIGSMCTGKYNTFGERFKAVHENINTLPDSYESLGFSTSDVPDAQLYRNWEHNNLPLTYTLQSLWSFNSSTFWSYNYGRFQPWETHEEIQIRFDLNKTSNPCLPCLYNEDTIYTNLIDNLNLSNFRRVPGLIYRADNIFAPPSVSIRYWPFGVGLMYSRPQIFYVPEPWMVTQGMLPTFKLFDTIYTVVDAGPVLDMNGRTGETGALHETPYIVTGDPHFTKHILYLGNSLEFGSYTVKLVEVNLVVSEAVFEIYRDKEPQESFWTRADPLYGFVNLQDGFPFKFYRECNDLNSNGYLDPGEATRIVHVQEDIYEDGVFDKWVVHHIEKGVWLGRQWEYYIDDQNDAWYLFRVVDLAISSTQVFTDDEGDGVEIEVYWLENKKYWYNQLCSDPWSRNPQKYQLFLDAYQARIYTTLRTPCSCMVQGVSSWS